MSTDLEQKRAREYSNRRMIMDFGMGIIYAGIGGFFALSSLFGYELAFPPAPFSYIFGGMCLLYGGFRIYRGYKKNYFH